MSTHTQTIATGMMVAWTTGWLMGLWARGGRRTYVNTRPDSSTDRPRRFQRSSTPRDRDPDWRRSFNHENTNRPSGPPPLRFRRSEPPCGGGEITLAEWEAMRTAFVEGRTIRGNGNGGPTTPKPDIIPRGQSPGGYQPRPQQGTPNPPPSEP